MLKIVDALTSFLGKRGKAVLPPIRHPLQQFPRPQRIGRAFQQRGGAPVVVVEFRRFAGRLQEEVGRRVKRHSARPSRWQTKPGTGAKRPGM